MLRAIGLALVCASAAVAARAGEVCLVCDEPAASYRCIVEEASTRYKLGAELQQEICTKVLAKQGPHQACRRVDVAEGKTCEGNPRTVSVTDYQRAMTANGESTYEVGALEIARRNVHDTWLCVTSMFKDC
jgi:hypothetical protein